MKTAHVIRCNDAVEYVVLSGKDAADAKLQELRDAHYAALKGDTGLTATEYKRLFFWRAIEVETVI